MRVNGHYDWTKVLEAQFRLPYQIMQIAGFISGSERSGFGSNLQNGGIADKITMYHTKGIIIE